MKTTYKLIAVSALALAIALPAMAQTDDSNQLPPPPLQDQGQQGQPAPGDAQGRPSIRAAIRADIHARVENAQNNQDVRNMLERRLGSSTPMHPAPGMMGDQDDSASDTSRFREDMPRPLMASTSMAMGSTTMRARFEAREDGDDSHMRQDMFETRKRMVAKELDVAIGNLNNISSRLSSRIAKEAAAGRDMTEASSSLVSANAQIQVAALAVTALENYLPTASSTVTASTTVSLDTARGLASTAQDDIKAAQRALNDVVVAIAHSMGLKIGDGHSGPESQSTASQ